MTYRDYAADETGMRKNNMILTKLMFIHRDYLFMYSCMLPYELWDLPNRLIVRVRIESYHQPFLLSEALREPESLPLLLAVLLSFARHSLPLLPFPPPRPLLLLPALALARGSAAPVTEL